jgi:hypothetical protein
VVEEAPHVLPTKMVGPSTKRSFQVVSELRGNNNLLKLEKYQRRSQQDYDFLIDRRKLVLSRDLLIDQMIEVFLSLHVCAPLPLAVISGPTLKEKLHLFCFWLRSHLV